MRLLLVEDDADLAKFVKEGLSREGFVVDLADDGQKAVELAAEQAYDFVLLDVMMPRIDGFTVLKTLRASGFKGGVLFATSKGQETDILKGLNSGADDYIVKPFLLSELVARIRAILRRTAPAGLAKGVQTSLIKVGVLELDLLKRELRRSGKPVTLTKKEFELLEYLMRRPRQVHSQEVLAQHLTRTEHESQTNTIEVHIKNLRSKLDTKPGTSLIRTVRGCGYSLEA